MKTIKVTFNIPYPKDMKVLERDLRILGTHIQPVFNYDVTDMVIEVVDAP